MKTYTCRDVGVDCDWKVRGNDEAEVIWQGQHFYFERLQHRDTPAENSSQWGVSRRGEFIGTMACPTGVATADFDVQCLRWLADLLA